MMKRIENSKTDEQLKEIIQDYLEILCKKISNRHVGSPGNREATDFFFRKIESFGFQTKQTEFDCIDWKYGDVSLRVGDEKFFAKTGPYSLPYNGIAELVTIATMEELEKTELSGKILLLHGEIASEQLMPKNFPFFNPERHQKIISLLEQKQPAAIIAVTKKNPELSGAMYPFPLIEDGDFDVPSVYMTDDAGEPLKKYYGKKVTLKFESRRIPAKGCNVIAGKGPADGPKIVVCAHIDAKKGTPGALDNAGGIAALLALAELLQNYSGKYRLEIVALNGEDYFAAPGQIQYLAMNKSSLKDIVLAINLDGAGYYDGKTHFSFYECSKSLIEQVRNSLGKREELVEGDLWYQSDHMIFVQNGCPAMAITCEKFEHICSQITHTKVDKTDFVDCGKLAEVALGLRDMIADKRVEEILSKS